MQTGLSEQAKLICHFYWWDKERGVEVTMLSDCQCLCTTMYRINQPHLLWVLDGLCGVDTKDNVPIVRNVVSVHPEAQRLAILALDRMLAHTGGGAVKV